MSDEQITGQEWCAQNPPASEREAWAIARAQARHREDDEALGALIDLDPLAREIADAAYDRGRTEVLNRVREIVGPASETVNAAALLAMLANAEDRLSFRLQRVAEGRDGLLRGANVGNVRAARLVVSAQRAVTAEGGGAL